MNAAATPGALRVLLVGEDPLARGGLAALLAGDPGFAVAQADPGSLLGGAASDGVPDDVPDDPDAGLDGDSTLAGAAAADIAAAHHACQVVLWDLGARRSSWLGRRDPAVADPGEEGPPALALVASEEAAEEALAAGALGVLFRDVDAARLKAALSAVALGMTVLDEALTSRLLRRRSAAAAGPAEPLTPRELEVLQLLAEGLSNKQIAGRLAISEHTAKFHVNSIVGKLGAHGRTDAAMRAARLGLIVL